MNQPKNEITHRYVNMDNRCYTTQEALAKYSYSFRKGIHRASVLDLFQTVVIGYGTKFYTSEEMLALDKRLQEEISSKFTAIALAGAPIAKEITFTPPLEDYENDG